MKKHVVSRPFIPEIVDADTGAYLLCISRSTYDHYVEIGFLPQADASFGNVKRWFWQTIVDHIARNNTLKILGSDIAQADPYLEALRNGKKKAG